MIKTKVKSLLISLSLVLLLCGIGLVFSACEEKHTHSFTDWSITEATCTEDGEKVRTCEDCGYEEREVINKLGHNYGEWTPTGDFIVDVHSGTHFRECSRCQDRQTGLCQYKTETIEATCDMPGCNYHYCEICLDYFEHDYTDPLGHLWLNQYAFVETKDGKHYHAQVCSRDRTHLNLDSLEECENCIDEQKTETVVASCGVRGYTKHTCKKCATSWETNLQDALTHNWQNLTQLPEMENGHYYHQYTCANCHEVRKEICGETETLNQQATCTTPSKRMLECETCNREWEDTSNITPAYNHSYKAWEQFVDNSVRKHRRQCVNCNEYFDEAACQFTTDTTKLPSCVQAGETVSYCEVCKYTETTTQQKLDHEWVYTQKSDNDHYRTCQNCKLKEVVECQFKTEVETEASCTTAEKTKYTCELCHREKTIVRKQPTGHLFPATIDEYPEQWAVDGGYHTRKCIKCGEEERRAHNYTESNLCKFCKHDGLMYEVVDGTHAVVYDMAPTAILANHIVIADTYQGYPVTFVESRVYNGLRKGFCNNGHIQTVLLPQNLEEIGEYCFYGCPNLKTVNIKGEGDENFKPQLVKIGRYAFADCGKLTTAANLPNGLTHIGERAFYNCVSLAGLKIPDSVKEIGDHAFTNTAFLNNLSSQEAVYVNKHLLRVSPLIEGTFTVTKGTLTIADEAFKNCVALETVVMYSEITEIGRNAFEGCISLTSVEYNGTFDQWFGIVFENDYSSPMSHATKLTIKNAGGTVKIPYGVTTIPAGTFKGTAVTKIEIPDTVTYIGEEAFENCQQLTEITFYDENNEPSNQRNLQYIGKDILKNTTISTKTTDESGVVYFDCYLIDASGLTAAVYSIKEGTKCIAAHAFENCTVLTSITFNKELEYINESAFVGCNSLSYLKFENPNGWFAYSNKIIGRGIDASYLDGKDEGKTSTACYNIRNYYTGNWKRSII